MSDTKQWPGTPAEWDAELTARMNRLVEANFTAGSRSVRYVATATMPPRPVELPSVTVPDRGCVTYDGARFVTTYAGCARAVYDDEAQLAFKIRLSREQLDAIRALRDGPAPRYEVCGWGVWKANSAVMWWSSNQYGDRAEQHAKEESMNFGGTAHAIYRRVEGA